jgi:hypothetical protein
VIKRLSPEKLVSSYCKNIHSNASAKEAYQVSEILNMIYRSFCKISSTRLIPLDFYNNIPYSISFYKNSIMHDLLHDVLEKTIPAGIPQYFYKYEQEDRYRISGHKNEEILESRRILSLNDLEYGFVLWAIACGISTTVFIIEYLGPKFMKVRDSVGIIYFMRLLRARLSQF